MITLNISVHAVSWKEGQEELKKLRSSVAFEKGIPISRAFDIYENNCVHFIAYDEHKTPLGCCRLMDNGRISRPHIPMQWQLKGVENKLIEHIVKYAKDKTNLTELSILEDARIAPYYVHFGFNAEGLPITEYGLPAQMMKYTIKREQQETQSDQENTLSNPLGLDTTYKMGDFSCQASYVDALRQIAGHCTRTIKIYSPTLPAAIFGDQNLLNIFSHHCRRSRFTEVKVLVLDEKEMISGTHGLRNLYEKLPSSISIRKLVPTDDEIDYREYMISDDGHMTVRARTRIIQGELTSNRTEIAKQITAFEDFWQRSRSIADLRLTTY